MRVDVVEILRLDAGIFQGERDGTGRRFAGLVRGHLVKRVAGEREAHHLTVDARAAIDRVVDRLQHQHAGALARHEAVAIAIERTARLVGSVIAGRQGADRVERRDAHLAQRSLAAPGEHDVGVAVLDDPSGVAQGMCRGRACRGHSGVGAA